MPSPKAQSLVSRVLEHRAQVKALAESRGQALHTSLMIASFTRAATQVRGPSPDYCLNLKSTFEVALIPQHYDDKNRFKELNGFLGAMEPRIFDLKPLWAESHLFAEHWQSPGKEEL